MTLGEWIVRWMNRVLTEQALQELQEIFYRETRE